jgi:adenylate cyclase class 2
MRHRGTETQRKKQLVCILFSVPLCLCGAWSLENIMAVEIEAKMAVPTHGPVREALRRRGARRVKRTNETNVFFDREDGSLRAGGEGLRLRTNQDAESGKATHVITHKGPLQPGQLKSREETEVVVDDPAATTRLFERLGLGVTLSFEKRRESWELGGCKVELDELPCLGTFVEIEGPGEADVMRVRESLGLADRPIVKNSYSGLLTRHLEERGISQKVIAFP